MTAADTSSTQFGITPSGGTPSTTAVRTATAVFAGRAVKRSFRRPDTVVSTVAFPVLLLLTMLAVFSSAVEAFEDADYAQRLVPGLIVSGIIFGSIGTALGFWIDLDSGFMERVRSMPVPSLTPLLGTVLAEATRALVAVAVLVSLGYAFGFRFEAGVPAAVAFVAVAIVAAITVTWVGLFLATIAPSQEALAPPLNAFFLVLLFFSKGLVPLEAYPGWAQPLVQANPMTAYVELLDRLARGGALVAPALTALAWSVGITAVFGGLAVRRLRD